MSDVFDDEIYLEDSTVPCCKTCKWCIRTEPWEDDQCILKNESVRPFDCCKEWELDEELITDEW